MRKFLAARNGWKAAGCGALAAWLGTLSAGAAPTPPPPTPPTASATPAAAPVPPPSPSPAPTPSPPPAVALTDIAPRGQEVLGTLKGFEAGADDPTVARVRETHPALTKNIDELRERGAKAVASTGSSLDSLRSLQTDWQKIIDTLIEQSESLGQRGRTLEEAAGKVKDINTLWNGTLAATEAKEADAPPDTVKLVREVLYNAVLAESRVKSRQTDVLTAQIEVGALLAKAEAERVAINQAISHAVKTLLVRDSPPIWSGDAQPQPDLPGRMRAAYGEQAGQIRAYLSGNQQLLGVHGLLFLALIGLFLWLRRLMHQWTEDEPHLKRAAPIFDVPVATALALSFLAMGGRYLGAPSLLRAAVAVAALLPTVVILRRLLARRLFPVLYGLVLFTLTDQIRVATTAFPALNRWLFCAEMTAAAGLFLWLWRTQKGGDPSSRLNLGRWMPLLCTAAVLVFVAALGANLLGYVRLGALLGMATLNSSYCAMFFYAALRVLDGLIVIALRVRPVSASRIAQTHRDEVQAQVYAVFRAVAVLCWLRYALEQLQIARPLLDGASKLLTTKLALGELSFSPDKVLWFAAAIWLSLVASRLLRFFLNEEVYERVQLAPGLPYAISTILNYVVLVIGFLVALGLLGVPLEKFTIVVSAFSVGLGFGLQNIINNFVSGVILLFERPVKVGDVIQLGDATGEVRRIGIRASILRTRDGSDVIVPNGNLISNQVTNWTYSDRSRAVEITLNVATGPEPAQVLTLLRAAVHRDPAAQDRPAPEAFITGLLTNGFTVVVRAWTGRYEDWVTVRSELNVTLHAVLKRENIQLV